MSKGKEEIKDYFVNLKSEADKVSDAVEKLNELLENNKKSPFSAKKLDRGNQITSATIQAEDSETARILVELLSENGSYVPYLGMLVRSSRGFIDEAYQFAKDSNKAHAVELDQEDEKANRAEFRRNKEWFYKTLRWLMGAGITVLAYSCAVDISKHSDGFILIPGISTIEKFAPKEVKDKVEMVKKLEVKQESKPEVNVKREDKKEASANLPVQSNTQ